MTLDELCTTVGTSGADGRRVVCEVLRVLEKGKELRTDRDAHLFIASDLARWTERHLNERIIEKRFRFLPRSNRFEPKISGISDKKIPKIKSDYEMDWCDFPDEELLYSDDVLQRLILEACKEYYKNRAVKIHFEETDARVELLQRSKLMFVDPRFVDASILTLNKPDLWLVHRCYLYRTGSWNALVYSYPRGPEQKAYSESLTRLIRNNPESLSKLRSVSKPV